jgi:histone deacetylase 6
MMAYLDALGLMTNTQQMTGREATEKELRAVHTKRHIESIFNNSDQSYDDDDMEGCVDTPVAARVAAGTTIETVLAVATGRADNAAAIVRPPGHHAEADSAMGFCCFNNVAIAVRAAQRANCGVERVLVVDWDVHHGNGTQDIFYDDPSVLTFSIHRRDRSFYPPSGFPDETGKGVGAGFSVNVGWSQKGMGDADYLLAFSRVLLPLAYQFNPDLVIISAGFDASVGDPLGGCNVTPAGFAHLTALLQGVSRGKLVMVQEGGYNLKQITRCFAACLRVLRGEAPPPLEDRYPKDIAYDDIRKTERALSAFWMGFGYAGVNAQWDAAEDGAHAEPETRTIEGGSRATGDDDDDDDDDKPAPKKTRGIHTPSQPPEPLSNDNPPTIPHGKVDMLVNGRLPPVGTKHSDRAPTWYAIAHFPRSSLISCTIRRAEKVYPTRLINPRTA